MDPANVSTSTNPVSPRTAYFNRLAACEALSAFPLPSGVVGKAREYDNATKEASATYDYLVKDLCEKMHSALEGIIQTETVSQAISQLASEEGAPTLERERVCGLVKLSKFKDALGLVLPSPNYSASARSAEQAFQDECDSFLKSEECSRFRDLVLDAVRGLGSNPLQTERLIPWKEIIFHLAVASDKQAQKLEAHIARLIDEATAKDLID